MINTRSLILLFFAVAALGLLSGCTSNQFKSRIRQQEAERDSIRIPIRVVIVPRPDQPEPERQATKDVLFDFNSSRLTADAKKVLERKAKEIINENWEKVVVVGHTDSVGSRKINRKMAEARAKVVADFLITQGVDPDKIQTVSAFFLWPVATNETPEGRAKNRRADVSIR